MLRSLTMGVVAALLVASAVPAAQAAKEKFKATLNGPTEVPATDSKGTGKATLTYDTKSKKLTYTLSYKGLTGDPIAAHFHGPADVGVAGGVELAIPTPPGTKSPIKGEATLNDMQAGDLEAGKWYVNIHTDAHKPGEIRGQVTK